MFLTTRCIRVFEIERPGREICSVTDVHGIVSTIDDDYSSCIAVTSTFSLKTSLVLLMEFFPSSTPVYLVMRTQLHGVLKCRLVVFMKFG